ncbi:hypothetical protein ACF059_31355 [Streptomyces sp. NPDC016562]|uniref:hypothetical protein n=1 Tax=Streptomyces sp. NPDC016562 TaxID=3364966 RepID=UPI0036F9FB04
MTCVEAFLGLLLADVATDIDDLSVLQTAAAAVWRGATAPFGGQVRLRAPAP